MYSIYFDKEKYLNSFGGYYDIYISMIKFAHTKEKLKKIKDFYIINNPFVKLEDKKFYLGYIHFNKKRQELVNKFINILSNKVKKRNIVLGRFVNIVKYNILKHKIPCNDVDLLSMEPYNRNNRNIYLRDIKNNNVWFFEIETITKTIASNLSYFDTETFDILCKTPIHPFTNNNLNTGQLISIYEQLYKYNCVSYIFMLYRLANFDINRFLSVYNNNIINYSYKYNIVALSDNTLLSMLLNIFNDNKMFHLNINKLDITNINTRNDIIVLIKEYSFTYMNKKIMKSIRKFINKHNYLIKRARRQLTNQENTENMNDLLDDATDEDINLSSDNDEDIIDDDDYEDTEDYESDFTIENEDENDEYEENNDTLNAIDQINAGILGYLVRKKTRKNMEKSRKNVEKWGKIVKYLKYNKHIENIDLEVGELQIEQLQIE